MRTPLTLLRQNRLEATCTLPHTRHQSTAQQHMDAKSIYKVIPTHSQYRVAQTQTRSLLVPTLAARLPQSYSKELWCGDPHHIPLYTPASVPALHESAVQASTTSPRSCTCLQLNLNTASLLTLQLHPCLYKHTCCTISLLAVLPDRHHSAAVAALLPSILQNHPCLCMLQLPCSSYGHC